MQVAPGSALRVTPYAIQHRSVEVHRSITDGSLAVEGMSQARAQHSCVFGGVWRGRIALRGMVQAQACSGWHPPRDRSPASHHPTAACSSFTRASMLWPWRCAPHPTRPPPYGMPLVARVPALRTSWWNQGSMRPLSRASLCARPLLLAVLNSNRPVCICGRGRTSFSLTCPSLRVCIPTGSAEAGGGCALWPAPSCATPP